MTIKRTNPADTDWLRALVSMDKGSFSRGDNLQRKRTAMLIGWWEGDQTTTTTTTTTWYVRRTWSAVLPSTRLHRIIVNTSLTLSHRSLTWCCASLSSDAWKSLWWNDLAFFGLQHTHTNTQTIHNTSTTHKIIGWNFLSRLAYLSLFFFVSLLALNAMVLRPISYLSTITIIVNIDIQTSNHFTKQNKNETIFIFLKKKNRNFHNNFPKQQILKTPIDSSTKLIGTKKQTKLFVTKCVCRVGSHQLLLKKSRAIQPMLVSLANSQSESHLIQFTKIFEN